ncbi:hypothetical protein R6Z07F_000769 [Ovis aries]
MSRAFRSSGDAPGSTPTCPPPPRGSRTYTARISPRVESRGTASFFGGQNVLCVGNPIEAKATAAPHVAPRAPTPLAPRGVRSDTQAGQRPKLSSSWIFTVWPQDGFSPPSLGATGLCTICSPATTLPCIIPQRFQENYQAAEAEGTGMGVTMISLQPHGL